MNVIIQALLDLIKSKLTQPVPGAQEAKPEVETPLTVPSIDWDKFKALLTKQLGKGYKFGVEDDGNQNPTQFDCSELVQWAYEEIGITVPDGSQNQFDASDPITNPRLGDVGFFKKPGEDVHHVGIIYDDQNVIEARGIEPSLEAQGLPDNQVILRPRAKWEAFSEFSGWRRFRVVKV